MLCNYNSTVRLHASPNHAVYIHVCPESYNEVITYMDDDGEYFPLINMPPLLREEEERIERLVTLCNDHHLKLHVSKNNEPLGWKQSDTGRTFQ